MVIMCDYCDEKHDTSQHDDRFCLICDEKHPTFEHDLHYCSFCGEATTSRLHIEEGCPECSVCGGFHEDEDHFDALRCDEDGIFGEFICSLRRKQMEHE